MDDLLKQLNSSDPQQRKQAIEALGYSRDPRAVLPLITALQDVNRWICHSAAEALVKIGQPAVKPLIDALKKRDWLTRVYAASALGKIGDQDAIVPLIAVLNDENTFVSREAHQALELISEGKAAELLVAYLQNENTELRYNAVLGLGRIADERVIQPLKDTLRDKNVLIRLSAARVLEQLGTPESLEAVAKWRAGKED